MTDTTENPSQPDDDDVAFAPTGDEIADGTQVPFDGTIDPETEEGDAGLPDPEEVD